jgi:hypothetical protein
MLYLARLNQLLHRSRNVFNWHLRVDAVLIEEIDRIDPQSLKGSVGHLLNPLGAAIRANETWASIRLELEPELGRDHDFSAERRQTFAHEFFVRERTVHLRRIEKCHAAFHRRAEKGDHLLLVSRRPIGEAHSHAPQAESRNL